MLLLTEEQQEELGYEDGREYFENMNFAIANKHDQVTEAYNRGFNRAGSESV